MMSHLIFEDRKCGNEKGAIRAMDVRGLPFNVKTEQSTRKFGKEAFAWVVTHNCESKNA